MSKFLLFAYIALCGILVVRSSPQKRFVNLDTRSSTLSPSEEENFSRKNYTNSPCPCSLNATSFGSMVKSPNLSEVQNVPPLPSTSVSGFVWKCNLVPYRTVREDYRCTPGIGTHKLHTRAKVWNEARKICIEEGGHLAIINSQTEANVLVDLFNGSSPFKDAAQQNEIFLGIHDLYTEGEWVTVRGDSLTKTGYAVWSDKWGGQPDNGGGIQNCGAMMDDGKLDDVACNIPLAFFCEIPDA